MMPYSKSDLKSSKKVKNGLFGYLFFGCCAKDELLDENRSQMMKGKRNNTSETTLYNYYGKSSVSLPMEGSKHSDYSLLNDAFPLNQNFLLGSCYKIIAKITEKTIATFIHSKDVGSPLCKPIKEEVFQEGSMSTKNLWSSSVLNMTSLNVGRQRSSCINSSTSAIVSDINTIPENIAAYIGNRLKCDVLIDAMCGCGTSSLQFAKYCNQVIAIDINQAAVKRAHQVGKASKDSYKIDFMHANFLHLKNFSADIVFLDPIDNRTSNSSIKFSIFKHLSPDPRDLVAKALQVSRSIALKLPADVVYSEIAELFHISVEKYGTFSKRFCIEIERVIDSETNLEFVIVYFGNCSSIESREEYEVIYDYFVKKEGRELDEKYPFNVVAAIIEKIGINKTCSIISEIEEDIGVSNLPVALWSMFKEKLVDANIFTKHRLDQAIEEGSLKPSSSVAGVASSHPSSAMEKIRSGPNFAYLQSVENSRAKRADSSILSTKKTTNESPLKVTSKFANTMVQQNVIMESDSPLLAIRKSIIEESQEPKEINGIIIKDHFSKKGRSPSPKTRFVDSEELSDLNVSSYSVNSGYLRDSVLDRSSQVESFKGDDDTSQRAIGDSMLGRVLFDIKPNGRSSARKLSDDETKPITSLLHKAILGTRAGKNDESSKGRLSSSKKLDLTDEKIFRRSHESEAIKRSNTTKERESEEFEITEDSPRMLVTSTVKGY